ncbi:3-carboxy-cis,cis-muconate cycloisomerase [Paracoccus sp. M683]|uniref:3-carboxy-cis,cis-muconate cycloisomerase n=1 Tax=Paracoccus sp. M683 TaxID=2594268 RepID=UPI00117FA38B|nr:3-carboxy-cis,cis-muconate cycloisomerase [Paracoccus sp. M683]TRW99437.1 3-carboxy-cis,cis-muconate cycloisomerase [Paracoccus sp. M683]
MTEPDLMGALTGDAEVTALFTDAAWLDRITRVEAALSLAAGDAGVVPAELARQAADVVLGFRPDMAGLRDGMAQDGLPIPEYTRQLKAAADPALRPALHVGATSQDILDTALMLALAGLNDRFDAAVTALDSALADLSERLGQQPLMGRTRMQAALPIRAADRLAAWRAPLPRHRERLAQLRPRLERVQYGGPVGLRGGPDGRAEGDAIADALADRLGLHRAPDQWHSARDGIAEYAGWLSLVTGSTGKIGQDLALMAQAGEVALSGGGTSSAMPHKQNPVGAETLVTLARDNAGQVALMHQAMLHEQERSGAAWVLEWLALPRMLSATARSLDLCQQLIVRIQRMGEAG